MLKVLVLKERGKQIRRTSLEEKKTSETKLTEIYVSAGREAFDPQHRIKG